jgi:hypothetical protein
VFGEQGAVSAYFLMDTCLNDAEKISGALFPSNFSLKTQQSRRIVVRLKTCRNFCILIYSIKYIWCTDW